MYCTTREMKGKVFGFELDTIGLASSDRLVNADISEWDGGRRVRHNSGTGRSRRSGRATRQPLATACIPRARVAEAVDLRPRGVGGQSLRSVFSGWGDMAGAG